MNQLQKHALNELRKDIVETVEFDYIVDRLLSYQVITEEQRQEIKSKTKQYDQNRALLDMLPYRGPFAYNNFVKSLEVDYYWLAEKLAKHISKDSPDIQRSPSTEENFKDAALRTILIQGGVPFPPAHLIPRQAKLDEVRHMLRELPRGHFIALHGMPGSGKSVIAAEAVRDYALTLSDFSDGIYWLSVGRVDKDGLLNKMQALCEKFETGMPPTSIDQASERLRKLLNKEAVLLILDDVWRGEVIRSFDVGCRVLITTRDTSVVEAVEGRYCRIKVHEGFTMEESLSYLANWMGVPKESLPSEAELIYKECKGSPMVLSLLGASLALTQHRPQDSGRWNHYLDKLKKRSYSLLRNQGSYSYENLQKAISISVDDLTVEERTDLQDLAIFLDDVNIPTEVLMVYWNVGRYEVEDRMTVLIKKSLVASHWKETSVAMVYGIHDVVVDYLKNSVDPLTEQNLHTKLVERYLTACNHDYGTLPNDNYIYWFLGYHLHKANMKTLFSKIYKDLGFIASKLRATGPADLLNDYRKYYEYISGEETNVDSPVVNDYIKFVKTCGHMIVFNEEVDIVQLALQQDKNSEVWKAGKAAAMARKDKFYVEWCNQERSESHQLRNTILSQGHVTSACFTHGGHRVLTAIGDGQIRLWDVDSGKEMHHFTGHGGPVRRLELSMDGSRFVSASADGSSKVWDLWSTCKQLDGMPSLSAQTKTFGATLGVEGSRRSNKTPSPRVRQDSWHNMFDTSGKVVQDQSLVTFSLHKVDDWEHEVLWACFSPSGSLIASTGTDKYCRVWVSTVANVEALALKHKELPTCCCFSPCGNAVITGDSEGAVRLWLMDGGALTFEINPHQARIISNFFLTDGTLLSVSDQKVSRLTYSLSLGPTGKTFAKPGDFSLQNVPVPLGSSVCINCAAVCPASNQLAVATSTDKVLLYDVNAQQLSAEYVGHSECITSLNFAKTDISKADECANCMWLLSGSHDGTARVWESGKGALREEQQKSLGHVFDAKWQNTSSGSLLLATSTGTHTPMVLQGLSSKILAVAAPEPDVITACAISNGGAMAVWATRGGYVKLMSLKAQTLHTLGQHTGQPASIVRFSPSDRTIVSGGDDGVLYIWRRQQPANLSKYCFGPRGGIEGLFFLDENQILVSSTDGSLKIWRLETCEVLRSLSHDLGLRVTSVDLSTDHVWLAQGTAAQHIQLWHLSSTLATPSPCQPEWLGLEKAPVRVVRFAQHCPFMAAGYDTGIIEVWDLSRRAVHTVLRGHKSWVRDLQFGTAPYLQLVSVGDRVIWWDLRRVHQNMPLTPVTPGVRSGLSLWSIPNTDTTDTRVDNPSSVGATSPRKLRTSPELLQTFELYGRFASKISVSSDFKVFVTLSDAGTLYILRTLDN